MGYFKRLLLFFPLLLLLSSCLSTEEYEKRLSSWVGSTEESLISAWGPPHRVYESGGTKYLTWVRSDTMTLPGSEPTYNTQFYGNTAYTTAYGGSDPITMNLRCQTTFTISGGFVRRWRWEGNNCGY